MRKKFTMLLASLFLCVGAWAQTAKIEVSTNVANPEHQYAMKNLNNVWMTSYTSTTQTKPGRFAFFASSGEDYQIYSIDRQKWVSYEKSDGYSNGTDKVVLVDAQADANVWKATSATNGGVAVYQFSPYKKSGAANIYMNWFEGLNSNPLDNDSKTVGFYGTGAGNDKGSAWLLTELTVPVAATKYVLQDKSGVYLDLVNLGSEPNDRSYNQLATLRTIAQPLYVTVDNDNKWKWSIHTAEAGGNYLHQYTGGRQWNSRVNGEGAGFRWLVGLAAANGELYYTLRHESGTEDGYLGADNHVNAEPLYVNNASSATNNLYLKVKEYQEGYLIVGPEGVTVTYNETVYAVGETIVPEGELTTEALAVTAPDREAYKVSVSVDNANSAVVVSYVADLKAGHKIILKNKEHNTYLGVNLEGGKLDNSVAPTTRYLTGYTTNNTYKNCWELVAAKYNEEDCFYLYNPYYDWYASPIPSRNGRITLSKGTDGAGRFQIEVQGDYIVFKCMTYADAKYQYLHQVDWRNNSHAGFFAVDWTADAGASQWTFEVVSEETENSWLNAITTEVENKKAYLEACELGSGIGQYSGIAAGDKDAVLAALAIPAEGTTAEKIKAGVYGLYPFKTLTLNQPAAGFYRIKSMNGKDPEKKGKYWQVNADATGMELNATAHDFNSIVYIGADKTILSYGTGLYVNNYYNPAAVGTEAKDWTIVENNAIPGTYALYQRKDDGSVDGYCLSDWLGLTYGQNDANAAWIFEEVVSLPVAVSAIGYATLYAPVALAIPSDVEVYTATINGNGTTLDLNPVTVTIPANTGVLIKAAEGTYNFNIADNVEAIEGNVFKGSCAKSYVKTDVRVYTLQNKNAVVGFYRYATETDKPINQFRAWIELPLVNAAPAMFSLDRGEGTTGIESVEAGEELVIFDLAGRRVQKMEKGIYIVNGKKVVIK